MPLSIDSLQNDFGNIAISLFVIAVGLISLVVFLFRLNRKNFPLLNFGLFSALYGLRWLVEIPTMQALMGFPFTLPYFHGVLTYLFVIPFCALLVNIFGKGLYNSMLLVLYSAIAYAVIAILFHVLGPGTSSDVAINRVVVIIWGFIGIVNVIFIRRKGDIELVILRIVFFLILLSFTISNIPAFSHYFSSVSLEHVSFVLLILGLGYVAMHHAVANERKLESIEQEIEIARRIQQFNLPSNVNSLQSINIAARYIPASTVAGDFYDIQKIDEAKAGILIADVSGHGVGAALIGSMLKIAFSSQAHNVSDPAKVLSEINRILQGKLESSFVTACAVFIDMEKNNLVYGRAGHPPAILWRSSTQELVQLTNGNTILGPFPNVDYENTVLDISTNDRLVLYTDGIIETSLKSGEFFGIHRFESLLRESLTHSHERTADLIVDRVTEWSDKSGKTSLDDDLTLVIIDLVSGED